MSPRAIYWSIGGVLVVLLVVMVVAWDNNRDNDAARAKADELIVAYERAGLPTPVSADQVARVLGDDGGSVCAAADNRQQLGLLKTQLAVGGEFYQRPVILPAKTLEGLRLIVATYCPEHLPVVTDFVDGLDFAN